MLILHLQDIFKFSNSKHESVIADISCSKHTHTNLVVECIEGKDLRTKNPNKKSNSFVIIYLESDPLKRAETSTQLNSCNPTWGEETIIPVAVDFENETLIVEVWECLEPLTDSLKRMPKSNHIKTMAQQMKRKVVSGDGKNRLIGKSSVALKSVAYQGLVLWLNLEKKGKEKSQGTIKLRLDFCGVKSRDVAAKEYSYLLKQMVEYDLENSKITPYWWCGKFSSYADDILREYTAQSPLTQFDILLMQYFVFGIAHNQYSLSFSLFDGLLNKILPVVKGGNLSSDEIQLFWNATKNILPSCLNFMYKIHIQTPLITSDTVRRLREVVQILSKISQLDGLEEFELFPEQIYS